MTSHRRRGGRSGAACGVLSAAGLLLCGGLTGPASAAPVSAVAAANGPLPARTVLDGTALGLTGPDDLARLGSELFVSFQNGVPSTGGSPGTPTHSTVVAFTASGRVDHRWQLTGKCDGLTADPAGHRLLATVNEDGNSSLSAIPVDGGRPVRYAYDANPLPHGGGTDSITVDRGRILLAASAPTAGTFGPALYQVSLTPGVAHLVAAPFYDSSRATIANTGSHGARTNLALTDPDSSTMVPRVAARFGGDVELTAQGDQQQIYVAGLGTSSQRLQILNLSQSVDDTAFASRDSGMLLASDATHNSVVAVSGPLTRGVAYTAVTPANADNAPPNPGPNYLGRIDLFTGQVTPVRTGGVALEPKGLLFVPASDEPNAN